MSDEYENRKRLYEQMRSYVVGLDTMPTINASNLRTAKSAFGMLYQKLSEYPAWSRLRREPAFADMRLRYSALAGRLNRVARQHREADPEEPNDVLDILESEGEKRGKRDMGTYMELLEDGFIEEGDRYEP